MSGLLDKVRAHQRNKTNTPEGLDCLLDMRALDDVEYLIYVRKVSMLQAKMEMIVARRTPEEWIKAKENQLRARQPSRFTTT